VKPHHIDCGCDVCREQRRKEDRPTACDILKGVVAVVTLPIILPLACLLTVPLIILFAPRHDDPWP